MATLGSLPGIGLLPTLIGADIFIENIQSIQQEDTTKHSYVTSSPAASPANLLAVQENAEERQMTVISGRKCSELLKSSSPVGSLAKMLLVSSARVERIWPGIWQDVFEQLELEDRLRVGL